MTEPAVESTGSPPGRAAQWKRRLLSAPRRHPAAVCFALAIVAVNAVSNDNSAVALLIGVPLSLLAWFALLIWIPRWARTVRDSRRAGSADPGSRAAGRLLLAALAAVGVYLAAMNLGAVVLVVLALGAVGWGLAEMLNGLGWPGTGRRRR